MPLARFEEWKGRIIAYFGGGGISAYSGNVAAKAQSAAEMTATHQEIFTAQFISGIGLFLVGCRLVFDIVVFIDKCRQRRKERNQNG